MKALQMNTYGNNDVANINVATAKPVPTENQLLIQTRVAGVNPVDWKIREGYLQHMRPLSFPVTLGMDFSGVVVEVGKNVSGFNIGDEVYGTSNLFSGGTGTFAEFLVADASAVAHKPRSISYEEAAALPMVGVSAFQALIEHMKLSSSKNKKILIHGGAGGIGSIAIQIAKHLGLYVATTASDAGVAFVKSLGADEVIDYKTQNFQEILQDYDAVLDTIGGETYIHSYQVLKKGGVIVSMLEEPNVALMEKYSVKALIEFTDINKSRLSALAELVDKKAIKIHLGKIFSFEQAREALEYQEKGRPQGKVVVKL